MHRSVTHGHRSRKFEWSVKGDALFIQNESGIQHTYVLEEVLSILRSLSKEFGKEWFPLANNVEEMYHGDEKPGLGMTIYNMNPGDTLHAQGSSYLGVVLEEVGILEWNREKRGIFWRLLNYPDGRSTLKKILAGG